MAVALSRGNAELKTHEQMKRVQMCGHCGQPQIIPHIPAGSHASCVRCMSTLHLHAPRGIQRTVAFSLAALILFIPANTLPILSISQMGHENESTIWGGVVGLWESGTQGIAILVLICSILIPLSKILGLFYICMTWQTKSPRHNTSLLRFINIIGRWSMLDVYLVAILVALVKLGTFASVQPELGLVAFSGVVVLTMIASANFDSRLLWLQQDVIHEA